jgi:hypothetical protein
MRTSTDNEHYSRFRQIQLLLEQHAFVVHQGERQTFTQANLKLSEETLEDIKGLLS